MGNYNWVLTEIDIIFIFFPVIVIVVYNRVDEDRKRRRSWLLTWLQRAPAVDELSRDGHVVFTVLNTTADVQRCQGRARCVSRWSPGTVSRSTHITWYCLFTFSQLATPTVFSLVASVISRLCFCRCRRLIFTARKSLSKSKILSPKNSYLSIPPSKQQMLLLANRS